MASKGDPFYEVFWKGPGWFGPEGEHVEVCFDAQTAKKIALEKTGVRDAHWVGYFARQGRPASDLPWHFVEGGVERVERLYKGHPGKPLELVATIVLIRP